MAQRRIAKPESVTEEPKLAAKSQPLPATGNGLPHGDHQFLTNRAIQSLNGDVRGFCRQFKSARKSFTTANQSSPRFFAVRTEAGCERLQPPRRKQESLRTRDRAVADRKSVG